MKKQGCENCGWCGFVLATSSVPPEHRIEQCDLCDTFSSDSEAVDEVFRLACLALDRQEKQDSKPNDQAHLHERSEAE